MKNLTTSQQVRLASIEKSIERNREMIRKGGDKKFYSDQILYLNSLAHKLENGKSN